jgi:hypothetical protein
MAIVGISMSMLNFGVHFFELQSDAADSIDMFTDRWPAGTFLQYIPKIVIPRSFWYFRRRILHECSKPVVDYSLSLSFL